MRMSIPGAARACACAAALLAGLLSGCGGGGGGSDSGSVSPPVAINAAPAPSITLAGQVTAGDGTADVSVVAGNEVLLNASSSKDPEGDQITFLWTLVSKPDGSALAIGSTTDDHISFKGDIPGTYVANLRVTDSHGAFADKRATILVRANAVPVITVTYSAVPVTMPSRTVTAGASVLFDASGTLDPDGGAVSTGWDLIEKPSTSQASLVVTGATARLATDAQGTYRVRARGSDRTGAFSEVIYPIEVRGSAPQTVVLATVTPASGNSGSNTLNASIGYTVALSGTGSSDPDGDTLAYAWALESKPAGSAVLLSAATGSFSQLEPDVLGDYVVKLVATDPSGASSSYRTTVSVKNRRPLANIASNATPLAMPNGPTLRLPVGTTLTLRGTASTDADGDALTYGWTMVARPASSTAALSSATGAVVQLTTDVGGSYQVRLRVTDPSGAYSEQVLTIESGNTPPVAVIDKSRLSVLAGVAAGASASLSYDDDGDGLTYSWAIDARPAGSSAAIAAPNSAQLAFTPDVAGTYVASVTVSDGKSSTIAYLTIKALASTTSNVTLPFVPLDARYSRGIDRFVAIATNPNALHIVDPFTGSIRQVPLPLPVKSFNLSADGKLAVVLHESVISLVDLESATLLRSSATSGSQTDAFVTNAGIVYMVGQSGGQWAVHAVSVVNGRTGADLTATLGSSGFFYGTMNGVFASTKHKGFVVSSGLTPVDIDYFTLDPATGAVTRTGDSPYHGDYAMSAPLFLSGNEDLVFTVYGNYFRTDTLQYAGQLVLTGYVVSMSHSSSADEALVMTSTGGAYQASYHRYTGALFLPDADVALPLIGGQQSYGVRIFHSANDNHVALVQVGSASPNAPGIQYYLVTR